MIILLVFSTLFLAGCKNKFVRTLGNAFGNVRKILAIPSIQIVIVFVISWIFFYTMIKYGLDKAGVLEGTPGQTVAIATAVLFTLPVIYGTRNIDFALFQTWIGFIAGVILGVASFWFAYNWLKSALGEPE